MKTVVTNNACGVNDNARTGIADSHVARGPGWNVVSPVANETVDGIPTKGVLAVPTSNARNCKNPMSKVGNHPSVMARISSTRSGNPQIARIAKVRLVSGANGLFS